MWCDAHPANPVKHHRLYGMIWRPLTDIYLIPSTYVGKRGWTVKNNRREVALPLWVIHAQYKGKRYNYPSHDGEYRDCRKTVGKQLKDYFHHLVSIHLIPPPVVWLLQQHQQHRILLNSSKKWRTSHDTMWVCLSGLDSTENGYSQLTIVRDFTFSFWEEVC